MTRDESRLLTVPSTRGDVIERLTRFTPLRVLGGTSRFLRVVLPSGVVGFVDAGRVEPASAPMESQVLADGRNVLATPLDTTSVVGTVSQGEEVLVHGRFGGYLYVMANGRRGWMVPDAPVAPQPRPAVAERVTAVVAPPSEDGSR